MTYILYNPLANGGHGYAGVKKIRPLLGGEKPVVRNVTRLNIPSFLSGLGGDDRAILCGGDGTLNFFLNAIDGQTPPVPVYVWQFGTGNDFLRDVDGGDDTRLILLNDHIRNLPCAQVQDQRVWYINGCSCGVDAMVCDEMVQQRRLRKSRKVNYTWLAVRTILRKFRPMNARVTVDGVAREYKNVWMVAAMNGRYQGGGMKFAPDQDRAGDELCCMVWHDAGRLKTLARLPSLFHGGHVKYTDICDIFFGHEITAEFDRATVAQLDGEVISGVERYTARKEPARAGAARRGERRTVSV